MIARRNMTGGINGSGAYSNPATAVLAGYTSGCDRANNKLFKRHLEAEPRHEGNAAIDSLKADPEGDGLSGKSRSQRRSHLYQSFNSDGSFATGYDSANRLLQYQRGVLSSTIIPYRVNAGASISIPITLPGTDQVKSYNLDGLGNWKSSNFTLVGSGGSGTGKFEVRQHNYVNEITTVKVTGGTSTAAQFSYDNNGNLLGDGVRQYQYDVFNRLIEVKNASGTVLATYNYDALNRRIQKTINNLSGGFGGLTGDIPAGTTDYLYDGLQIIEERDNSTPTVWTKAYFWGQYIDELMFLAVSGPTVYRVLSDLLYRSVAIATTSNAIVEAYDTDAYGNTLCYGAQGSDGWFSSDDIQTNNPINTTIFTGRQYEPESQIYYYRARYYSPDFGRFISRDPIGLLGGINLYTYCSNNPVSEIDPSGLKCAQDGGEKYFGGADWQFVTYSPSSTFSINNYIEVILAVVGKWQVEVQVICDCCKKGQSKTFAKQGEKVANTPLQLSPGGVVQYNSNVGVGDPIPIFTGKANGIGTSIGQGIQNSNPGLGPTSKESSSDRDIRGELNNVKPTSPDDGDWQSGNPCDNIAGWS